MDMLQYHQELEIRIRKQPFSFNLKTKKMEAFYEWGNKLKSASNKIHNKNPPTK
jgi:hypothetical protein